MGKLASPKAAFYPSFQLPLPITLRSVIFFFFSTGSRSCICAHRIERSLWLPGWGRGVSREGGSSLAVLNELRRLFYLNNLYLFTYT